MANDKNIVAIKIGNNIKDLGEGVFGNCENLRYVVLGDSVKTIGCNPFLIRIYRKLLLMMDFKRLAKMT